MSRVNKALRGYYNQPAIAGPIVSEQFIKIVRLLVLLTLGPFFHILISFFNL
jgi:hypothetical protein